MTLSSATGVLSTGTGAIGTTIPVSGLGFQPKALLLFWNGSTASTDTIGRGDHYRGVGWAASTSSRGAITMESSDTLGSSDGGNYHTDAACIATVDLNGVVSGLVDLQSFDADGFTLVIDDVMPFDLRVGWVAYGGTDITNAASGVFQSPTGAGGTVGVTGVGFQPTIVFAACIGNLVAPPDGQTAIATWTFGAATDGSNEFVIMAGQDVGSATMDTGAHGYTGGFSGFQTASTPTTVLERCNFASMDSDGFSLTWDADNANAYYYMYFAIQGGNWAVGAVNTRTDTTAFAISGLAFAPASMVFVSVCRAQTTPGTGTTDDRTSFGAATSSTNRWALGILDENGTANAEVTRAIEHDEVYVNIDTASAIQGLMDVTAFNSDGVSLVMDDADPSAAAVFYIAAGSTAVATSLLVPRWAQFPPALAAR